MQEEARQLKQSARDYCVLFILFEFNPRSPYKFSISLACMWRCTRWTGDDEGKRSDTVGPSIQINKYGLNML